MPKEKKIKIFVARRWPDNQHPINGHILNLIRRAGMDVSKEMDKSNLNTIELKMAINILDADAFCAILTPQNDQIMEWSVNYELATAKKYKIPSFVFVDRTIMGEGPVYTTVRNACFGLETISKQWIEFWDKELLSCDKDEEIINWLGDIKERLRISLREAEQKRQFHLASLMATDSETVPFNIGLEIIANAYDQNPQKIYDVAAEVASKITGAQFGFVGLLHQKNKKTLVKIKGISGVELDEKKVLDNLELGFDETGNSIGVTGYVAKTGNSFIEGELQNKKHELMKEDQIKFIDPNEMGINSEVCVSIKLKDKVIGIIDVEHRGKNMFNSTHLALLEWLSIVLAIVYSSDQLENFIQELSDVAIGKKQIGQIVLNALMKFTQADYGFVAIVDKSKICKIEAIIDREITNPMTIVEIGRGLTGNSLEKGKAFYISDVRRNKDYYPCWKNTISEIVLPILGPNNEIMGIINLEFKNYQNFELIDKNLFLAMAKLIAPYISR